MTFTDQDVREGRRLMDDGRKNRLAIGDKLLAIAGAGNDQTLEAFCDAIGLSARTGRDYRYLARVCTPPLRAKIAATGVMVSYSVLREGARAGGGGVPVDEGYRKLLVLLEEAVADGRDQLKLPQYHQALGTAPALRDLMDPSLGDSTKLVEYLGGLQGGEREKIVVSLLEADAGLRKSVRKTIDEQRRRERDRERIDGGEAPGQWMALARDLLRVGDQSTSFLARYQSTGSLTEQQLPAAKDALIKVEMMATWIKLRLGSEPEPARRQRGTARVSVAR